MLRFRSLGSGSAGNATLVEARDGTHCTRVLVDCGFGLKQLEERLARASLAPSDIDAVFVTHEHGDHVGCAHGFSRRHGVTVWMSEGTWRATGERDYDHRLRLARDGEAIEIGALRLSPFTVPHDAREPLQLRCTDGVRHLGLLTDLGHATPHVLAQLAGLDALMLEFNHDVDLLASSRYHPSLKRRVGGDWGHLSNAAAVTIAAALKHAGLRHLVGAHLSEQNNRPEIVREALAKVLDARADEMLTADAADGTPWLDL
jgi:phosphoribosyl 1,2-cyclic phosphodiesterase